MLIWLLESRFVFMERKSIVSILIFLPAFGACVFWGLTINQPLIDQHAFRQTQTALSALFMQPGLDGFFNYQTPAIGSPWSVPFEVPLFQWLVHGLAQFFSINLSTCGRLLSIVFGIGCLWPALTLLRCFDVKKPGQACFFILYFSSAIYLYWNRAFMIESTALFFSLWSLYLYALFRIKQAPRSPVWGGRPLLIAAFGLSLSLGLLVKATTGLPILLLISIDLIWQLFTSLRNGRSSLQITFLRLLPIAIAMLAALLLLRTWTLHADALKDLNPIGANLTSAALNHWNFGTVNQRFSSDLWFGVLIARMLTPIGAIPAVILLLFALMRAQGSQRRTLIGACIFLTLVPLLIFSNLHIVHTYYQSANQVFLLLAISAAFDSFVQAWLPRWQQGAAIAAITLFTLGSYQHFNLNYLNSSLGEWSYRLDVAKLIKQNTPDDAGILVFDDGYSSEFAFHSHRRALALPDWPTGIDQVTILNQPSRFLDGSRLGAVIAQKPIADPEALAQNCSSKEPQIIGEWKVYLCKS